jgi:hypothetical protein
VDLYSAEYSNSFSASPRAGAREDGQRSPPVGASAGAIWRLQRAQAMQPATQLMPAAPSSRICGGHYPALPGRWRFLLRHMVAVAELEGMISARTRAALGAAKARGTKLGGPKASGPARDLAARGLCNRASVGSKLGTLGSQLPPAPARRALPRPLSPQMLSTSWSTPIIPPIGREEKPL